MNTSTPSPTKCTDYETDYADDEITPVWVHVLMTLFAFGVFCLSIQQLLGAPTSEKARKVFRYRATVAISSFTTLLIAITLNFELTQDAINKDNDRNGKGSSDDLVEPGFVLFVYFLMILFVSEALILGYWFLIDAVGAAYKAANGINKAEPPSWIRKFWLIVIVAEQSILVLCFIFAFVMQNTIFTSILWVTGFLVAFTGSVIVLISVVSVFKTINSAIQSGNNTQVALKESRKTLTLIAASGIGFGGCALTAFVISLTRMIYSIRGDECTFERTNIITSQLLDTTFDYLIYVLMILFFNLCLMLWTYRSSNINYCCFCWTYKNYTKNEAQHRDIDETVVCYKCFPTLIEKAEEQRQAIIEDSLNNTNGTTNETPNTNTRV